MSKLLFFALACVPASVAHATTMVFMDLGSQAAESDAFIAATVGASRVVHGERKVYTDTELHVESVLGGRAPERLVVRQVGGTIGERTIRVPGDAQLVEGERIYAFVRQVQGQWYFTVLGQSVWYEAEDGALIQATDASHLMHWSVDGQLVPASSTPLELFATESLVDTIETLSFGGEL